MRKTLPRPSVLSSSTRPPWASAVHLTRERSRPVLPGETRALVPNLDEDLAAPGPGRDGHARAFRHVLDGVVRQVHHRLAQGQSIAVRHDGCGGLGRECLLPLLGENAEVVHDLAGEDREVEPLETEPRLAGFRSSQREELVREAGEPVHLLQHAADDLAAVLGRLRAPKAHLTHAPKRGEGRPKLVGGICSEAPKLSERSLMSV